MYANDFETPNRPIAVTCGGALDGTGIDACYGQPGFRFVEEFSVETVVLRDPAGRYQNQGRRQGDYALGMRGDGEDDKLALLLQTQSQRFLNVTMDLSSIDVAGCGGPFGVETPRFRIRALDSPDGVFDWDAEELDAEILEGQAARDRWTFQWSRGTVALDVQGATRGDVIVVFDLVSRGYAVFDNLVITATPVAAVADRDRDGVEDAMDNCFVQANGAQADQDGDSAGDACDPAPADPNRCGDRDGNGRDDCQDLCEQSPVPQCQGNTHGSSGTGGSFASQPPQTGTAGSPQHADDAGVDDEPEDDRGRSWRWGGGTSSAPDGSADDGGCAIIPGTSRSAPWLAIAVGLACCGALRRRIR